MTTSFSQLPIHPRLAEAIAARGYESATPVQAAVLDPKLDGQDLLVSSQTGSGKTLAFGILIARDLLADGAVSERPGRQPRALVVAPTRELAVQVSGELRWLFENTGLAIASFTGGTHVGADVRALKQGVHIAVGTPGRLVDLHQRGLLDLSMLTTLVLDEGDEMLDLGFKDDLEYLLGHAPEARRTLLFSATMPPEIVRMAAQFQRDARRVDARSASAGKAHQDITFVAHLVNPGERLATVVNLLLVMVARSETGKAGSKAIVFCRTRDRVGELHQHLLRLGLRAMAIAGDRAQSERDRALQALREGAAEVLVATNVAARGLDLPDVDHVIHADLPDNVESLTHRSGRTGRAGRKGTSIVIAEARERRKADRMLGLAGVKVPWSAPPDASEVRRHAQLRLVEELTAASDATADEHVSAFLDTLGARLDQDELLTLLLSRELARLPAGMAVTPVKALFAERDDRKPRHGDFGDAVAFTINLGHEARAEARWLLPLICRRGGVTRNEIGSIRIGKKLTTFEIARHAADAFAAAARRPDPHKPDVVIARADAQAEDRRGTARPVRPPRPARERRAGPAGPARKTGAGHPGKGGKTGGGHGRPAPVAARPHDKGGHAPLKRKR